MNPESEVDVRVYVESLYRIIFESLSKLLESYRFSITSHSSLAQVALVDLSHLSPPYAPPFHIPTLALIRGSYTEAKAVISSGYKGYLTQDSEPDLLPKALTAIARGELWAERKLIADLIEVKQEAKLSQRELEIYTLIQQGLSNQSIAQHLNLSVSTVKGYITSLLQKQNVKSRLELVTRNSKLSP
jgi:DNA-binding NarL/FixJ family response regulator